MPLTPAALRRLIHGIALGQRAPGPGGRADARAAAALGALRRRHHGWWEDDNVVGLCAAHKVKAGRRLGSLALQVLVREKRPLAPSHRRCVPRAIDGRAAGIAGAVPTDVREVGRGHLDVLVSDARPVAPGFNVGGARTGSGTLTCAVRSRAGGALLGLSCGHVIARSGQASPGEAVVAPSYENAAANDLLPLTPLGRLVTVLPIGFQDADAVRNVDAATFAPDAEADLVGRLALLDRAPSGLNARPALGLRVQKVGYATELTFGAVQALHLMVQLEYADPAGGLGDAMFADLIGVSSFTQPGDSGALVLDESLAAVGLHMGSFRGMSVCMPMARVLDAVGCDLA